MPKAATPLNRLRWRVEYLAVRGLGALLVPLPHPVRLALGRALGRLAFALDGRHRRVALENLAAALPERTAGERRGIARDAFAHLGRLLVEVLLQRRLAGSLDRLLDVEGIEHLERAAAAGRGYFLLSGHLGNWEWIALRQGALGHPLWMVARPLDNPLLEAHFAALRGSTGNTVVYKRNAVREMVRGLRAGAGIAFMLDQYYTGAGAQMVSFFGRPAATTPALGSLAVRLRAPIVPVFSEPLDGGRYRVRYLPPLEANDGADPDAEAARLTAAATALLEDAIRRSPSAWFWMHRRWRER